MATSFSPTPAEAALVNQIFNKHDPEKFGIITSDVAVNLFRGANLSAITLGQIWGIADAHDEGFLTRKGVSVAVRLIGWAQKGDTISGDLVNKPGPLAVIDGYPSPSELHRAVSPSPGSSRLPPPLTAQDKAKFTRIFNSCGPVNGLLLGQSARDVFVKSKLPLDKLSQIWNLSDTQKRGSLDVTDFIIAMYLIQASMSGQLPFIPTTLPPGLYEMVSGKGLPGSTVTSHATGNSGSFSPGVSSTFPQNGGSGVVQPHLTGRPLQPQYSGQALQQQFTGPLSQHQTGSKSGLARNTPASPSFAAASAAQSQLAWDVTPTEKAGADKFFDTLDTHKRGYIEADSAVPFFLLSKLPGDVLASIWDLADLNNDGRLTRDGFAVALHLMQGKLVGKDIPTTLPASLIPPSMRPAPVPATSPFQPPPSESLKDLIWDDTPSSSATSQPHSTILQPQRTAPLSPQSAFSPPQVTAPQTLGQGAFGPPASNKNLLDDDEDAGAGPPPTAIHDHSVEIGNLQNQLQSTTRSLENTKTERSNVEGTVESQAIQLSTLQTQLGSAKAAYGAETRLLATLRERFSNQSSEIQKAREELIRAESDLSAIRVEKTEVEQNLLRDKEEIRELQRKMTETGSMIEVAKVEIEKAKKDAKQQKGRLAIAKKQLATREAERVKAAQELQESVAEAEETKKELDVVEAELSRESPLAATTANGLPLAPSPALSGDSTTFAAAKPLPGTPGSPSSINDLTSPKSNNPFERFAPGSAPRSQSPFLPLANTSIPTATDVNSVPNEGTTTDNPFTFDQAFGSEEPGPAPDVDETSTANDETAQSSVPKLVGELSIVTNEELSSPSSDRDLFSTPPMTGLEALGTGTQPSTSEPSALKLPPPGAPPAAPLTDRPPEAHTDINAQLKELDVDGSDSSDEDSEDETPLAALASRPPPPPNKADAKPDAAKEELVSNGHTSLETKAEAPFPPVPAVAAPAEVQSISPFPPAPFPPAPAQNNSPFPATASPFAAPPEAPKVTNVSDFDKVFGDIAGAVPTATGNKLSFEGAFDDQFDFGKEGASTSPPAAEASSSGSTTFPPPPAGLSGVVIPPASHPRISPPKASPPRASGFENAFIPQQSTTSSVRPVSTVDGLPPLPQIPESMPFSFDDAFASLSPTHSPAVLTNPAPSQPPPNTDAQSPSPEDVSGSNITGRDSGFGTTLSRSSSVPQVTQSPVSAVPSNSPTRGSTSPRDSVGFPISQPRQASPPPRITSPKARPSTSSSKESSDRNKEQGRPSKISMIRLPFTKRKKTQESPPPPQHMSSIANEGVGRASPAVDDDVDSVKQLCSMGFSRTQAVAALETSSYDFQRALNSLLSG